MEHGGGNNSTFTTHVVSSSGTDTYSAIAAALGSLKGPKHGGANIKVVSMFQDMKEHLEDWSDEEEIKGYLTKLLHKEAFDKRGLIYGMGHAVYSISDPRAQIFKKFVRQLAEEKGRMKDYELLCHRGTSGSGSHSKRAAHLQGVSALMWTLQRFCVQHAGTSAGTVYTDVCHCPYCRLECAPHGRVD